MQRPVEPQGGQGKVGVKNVELVRKLDLSATNSAALSSTLFMLSYFPFPPLPLHLHLKSLKNHL